MNPTVAHILHFACGVLVMGTAEVVYMHYGHKHVKRAWKKHITDRLMYKKRKAAWEKANNEALARQAKKEAARAAQRRT